MTAILEWPNEWYRFASAKFYLSSTSKSSTSPWSRRTNVYGPHAQMWMCELSLDPQNTDIWMPMEALFAQLGGISGMLRISDPARLNCQFNVAAAASSQAWSDGTFFTDGLGWSVTRLPPTCTVTNAAAMLDTAVQIGGLVASTQGVFKPNDLIEFRRNGRADETPSLHVITGTVKTNSNGKALVPITPPLRKGLGAGDMAVLRYPQSVFRLADDSQGVFERTPGMFGAASFKLVEALI